MSQVDSGNYSGMTPAAPPTEPPPMLDEPKSWPKVIGIISITWASVVGLGCNACAAFMPQIMGRIIPEDMKKDGLPPNLTPNPIMYGAIGLGVLVSILLLVAGIALVRRKRSGRALHLVWAVLGCLMAVLGLYMQWRMNGEVQVWMQQHPDSQFAKQAASQGDIGPIIGYVMGAVFGLAYPVFCLVWFGLVKRNAAEIDSGVEESVI